jgi:hypothetical protein
MSMKSIERTESDNYYERDGIPTDTPREGEKYLENFGMYVSGYEESPYNIEWMRFEPGSTVHELIRKVPHIAFEVDDLEEAIAGREVIVEPNSPSDGIRVAFIVDNGAPVEFLEIERR